MSNKIRNKKHRNIFLVCLLTMIFALTATACDDPVPAIGKDTSDEFTETNDEVLPPADAPVDDTAQDLNAAQIWESVYEAVIKDEPHSKIRDFFAGTEEYGYEWSYGYYDIDENGVSELLIALSTLDSTMQSGVKGIFIKQIWTAVDGAGVLLLEDFGEGDTEGIYICDDGVFGTQQFSDTARYRFYKIIEGKSAEEIAALYRGFSSETGDVEFYFHEGKTAAATGDHGEKKAETEFNEILDKYGSDPDAQNLTEWLPLPTPKAGG